MKGKKILVFIDNDAMVRHFIANNTFAELSENNEILYVFNQDIGRFDFKKNKIIEEKISFDNLRFTNIPRKRVGRWFLLYIINVFRQQRIVIRNKGSIDHFKAIQDFQIRGIGKRNVKLAKLAGLPIIYQLINYIFKLKLGIHKDIIELLEKEKPDLLIHPSFLNGYYINEIFRAAPRYKIPLIVLVNSWDNCCCKAFCTGYPDKLVVWGEQAKQHAKLYLNMPEEKIECFGAAQFEIYKTPPKESRKELADFFKVSPDKKILLYAGVSNSENETTFLKLLDEGIRNSTLEDCHVIYRPHPWRGSLVNKEKDFLSLKWDHISIDPTMEDFYQDALKNPTGRMYPADYEISNKLLTLVDGVISPLSTMLVEALIKGKPVLAFFPETGKSEPLRLHHIHYAEFVELKEANSCFDKNEFIPSCKNLLNQIGNNKISNTLKKKSEFFVTKRDTTYGYQLTKLCEKILNN